VTRNPSSLQRLVYLDGQQAVISLQGLERRQILEHGRERPVIVAAHQEVVAEREEHVDVRLGGETAQESREALLHGGRVQREELLELVEDDERSRMSLPPPGEHGERRIRVLEAQKLPHRLRVSRELSGQRLGQREEGRTPGGRENRLPALRSSREHPRPQERGLPRTRRPDERQQLPSPNLLPEHLDLELPAEEVRRVLLGEGGQTRVRVLVRSFPSWTGGHGNVLAELDARVAHVPQPPLLVLL